MEGQTGIIAVLLWSLRRSGANPVLAGAAWLMLAMAILEMVIFTFGDAAETTRHLFIYNALADLMILAAIGAVIARFEPAGSLAMPSELTSLSALVGVGLILAALAVVSFVTGTWSDTGDSSGQAPKLVVPAGKAVIGFVDVGEGKSSVSVSAGNDLAITGWAACVANSPLSNLEIMVDQKPIGTTTITSTRPDVAAAYGRPEFEKTGWKTVVPVRGIPPGAHELTAKGTCANGQNGTLPPRPLVVTGP